MQALAARSTWAGEGIRRFGDTAVGNRRVGPPAEKGTMRRKGGTLTHSFLCSLITQVIPDTRIDCAVTVDENRV